MNIKFPLYTFITVSETIDITIIFIALDWGKFIGK